MNSAFSPIMFQKPISIVLVLALSPVIVAAEEPADLVRLRESDQKERSVVVARYE